jgi:two-component system, NarL family, nitrate/nitrite response regulator NarL
VAFVTGVAASGLHLESERRRAGSLNPGLGMATKILVLVIEDNRLLRDGLAALLEAQPDFKVVAAAEGANVGLLRLHETKPHVVLVDATLENHDSRRVVESVRKTAPEARVIVMDLLPAEEDVIEFIKAGANGFIVKDATVEEFVRTIRSVAEGTDVVPPALTGTLLSHIVDRAVFRDAPVLMEGVRMTKREREVIDLVAEGLGNKEIAQRLSLPTHTVKSYVRHIMEKLALHSRLQLAVFAHQAAAPEANRRTPPPTNAPATKKPADRTDE